VYSAESQPIFRRNKSPTSSGSINKRSKKPESAYYQHDADSKQILASCFAYSLTLKMEVTCSSETSVGFQRTTRLYTPEDKILHNHRHEKLKSYVLYCVAGPDNFA
jgi:hypothetical protein